MVISWYFDIYHNNMEVSLCSMQIPWYINISTMVSDGTFTLCYDTVLMSALQKWRHVAFLTDGVAATKTNVYKSIKCIYLFETENGYFFIRFRLLFTYISQIAVKTSSATQYNGQSVSHRSNELTRYQNTAVFLPYCPLYLCVSYILPSYDHGKCF